MSSDGVGADARSQTDLPAPDGPDGHGVSIPPWSHPLLVAVAGFFVFFFGAVVVGFGAGSVAVEPVAGAAPAGFFVVVAPGAAVVPLGGFFDFGFGAEEAPADVAGRCAAEDPPESLPLAVFATRTARYLV